MAKTTNNIDTLVERAMKRPATGPPCFAAKLEGEAKEFLDRLREQYSTGGEIVYTVTTSIMRELGVNIGYQQIRRHIRGDCTCGEEKES